MTRFLRFATILSMLLVVLHDITAAQSSRSAEKVPIQLRDFGSFYVNGQVASLYAAPPAVAGTQIINQMYVQYMIPVALRKNVTPIVLVHGSGHTGKTYETTPDGRDGWATYFVRQGIPVYIVDQPGRARSSFDPSLQQQARAEANPSLLRNLGGFNRERAWTVFRVGPTPFVPHPGTQFPLDATDQYYAQLVPNTDGYLADPATRVNALAALLDKIGPAVVSVHSMSGTQGIGVAIARPNLVQAVVDVEPPGGCVISDAHVTSVFTRVPLLAIFGDYTQGDALWGPAAASCQSTANRIQAAGGIGRNLVLPDIGIFGNSHMLMLDKNSDQIAEVIVRWLEENVWLKGR